MSQPESSPYRILDGKYELTRKLGEGGMGAVYEGRHRGTGRRVAVKVIAGDAVSKNAEVVGRFEREAMASGAIESQYIAQVLDTGVDSASGSPYLVMELLTGDDLERTIQHLGPLNPDLALRVIAQACLGLQKAHDSRVIHRDIKPANLFLARREGSEVIVKLLDFGIAKAKTDDAFGSSGNHAMTRTGMMLGSPLYMSPEQAMGRKSIDHRTDIWSLGVVLYEALCGRTPHGHAETIGELVIRICGEAPQLLQERAPWVPPEVAAIAHKALALDPAARFQSANEMLAAVRARLPRGHQLEESLFVALTPESRAMAAPRWSLTSDVRQPAPSFPSMSQSNPDLALLEQARVTAASLGQQKSTTAGFGQSGVAAQAAPRHGRAVVPIAVAVAAIGIAGGLFVARGSHTPSPAPVLTQASAATTPPQTLTTSTAAPPAPLPPVPADREATIELPATPVASNHASAAGRAAFDVAGVPRGHVAARIRSFAATRPTSGSFAFGPARVHRVQPSDHL